MAEAELVEVIACSSRSTELHQPPDKPWYKDIAYGSVRCSSSSLYASQLTETYDRWLG